MKKIFSVIWDFIGDNGEIIARLVLAGWGVAIMLFLMVLLYKMQ